MKNRLLGTIEVSPIGTGCMGFSHGYGPVPEESEAIEAIRSAHAFGCTFFDTAETYGREQFFPGHNEQLLGKAVLPFRQHVVLATKIHISTDEYRSDVDLRAIIRRHLEKSLKNLQTDYVDLYYLHRVNEEIPVEDIAEVMGGLIREGCIRGWGMSQVDVRTLKSAHAVTPVSAVQNLYNMLERDCEAELFPYCLQEGIGVVPFSPIASGFLSGNVTAQTRFEGDDVRRFVPQLSRENIQANQPVLELLGRYAGEKHATRAQISLAWMLKKYANAVPIPGSKNRGRILENLGAWDVCLTDSEFAALEESLNGIAVHGHRGMVETEQHSFSRNWRKEAQ